MTIPEGVALIETPKIDWTRSQHWCDLGCGRGLFTRALATLLAQGSSIHAVDRDRSALRSLPNEYNGCSIIKLQGDLADETLPVPASDGMLLANVLHFLANGEALLRRLKPKAHCLLVVEYERRQSTPWGPYSVLYERLCALSQTAGFASAAPISTRPSRWGGTMYSALLHQKEGSASNTNWNTRAS